MGIYPGMRTQERPVSSWVQTPTLLLLLLLLLKRPFLVLILSPQNSLDTNASDLLGGEGMWATLHFAIACFLYVMSWERGGPVRRFFIVFFYSSAETFSFT